MIIAVAGLPGSGKSYFAAKLAARLNAVYISSDRVRKSLDRLGKYSQKDKLFIYNEMVRLAEEALRVQKVVIVDATFYRQEMRLPFFELAHRYSVSMRFILVYASEAVIIERLSNPRSDSEADFKVYQIIKAAFEEMAFSHLKLESTNDNLDTMLKKAIEFIRSAHEGKSNHNAGSEGVLSQ